MFNLTDDHYDWIVSYVFKLSIGAIFIMLLIRWTYTYFERNYIHCVQQPSFPTGNMGPVHRAEIPIYIQLWKFYQKLKKKQLRIGGFYCYFRPCIIVADQKIIKKVLDPCSGDFGVLKYTNISEPSTYYTLSECNDEMMKVILDVLLKSLDRKTGKSYTITATDSIHFTVSDITVQTLQILFEADALEYVDFLFMSSDIHEHLPKLIHKLKLLTTTYPMIDMHNEGKSTKRDWLSYIKRYLKLKEIREKCASFKTADEVLEKVSVENMLLTHYFVMKKLEDAEIAEIYCKLLQYVRHVEYIATFALKEMFANPSIEEKLRQEIEGFAIPEKELSEEKLDAMKYLEAFACEALRKYPINPFYIRRALHAVEINNIVLKKDQLVFVPTMAVQRDRDNYPNPHHFNPDRFLSENSINPLKYFPCASSSELRVVKNLLKAYIFKVIKMDIAFESYVDDISIKTYWNLSYCLCFDILNGADGV